MKKISYLSLLLLTLAACMFSCSKNDDKEEDQIHTDKTPADIDAVDLELPSGTLWANMNIGANSPENDGLYYAWAETEGYTIDAGHEFAYASTYKFVTEEAKNDKENAWKYITKYQVNDQRTEAIWYDSDGKFIGDGTSVLSLEDDAAHVAWGGDWCIPSYDDIKELIDNTTSEWTTVNGVAGCKLTGKNGKSIFLPASGFFAHENCYKNGMGLYWTSNVTDGRMDRCYTGIVYSLFINKDKVDIDAQMGNRSHGQPVRPIIKKK